MNLPNCPCRSTVTGLQSTTTGSLGLIVQTSVSPVVVVVSRKMMLETWGTSSKWWCVKNPAGSMAAKTGLGREFRAQITGVLVSFRRWGQREYDGQLPSFRSVPSTAGEVAGIGRKHRVTVAGYRVGSGSNRSNHSLSLSLVYSLSQMQTRSNDKSLHFF